MIRRQGRLGSIPLVTVVAVVLAAFGGVASAKSHHRRCSLTGNQLAAELVFPCNKASLAAGRNITFKVRDSNSKAHRYHPFIELTKRPPNKHGIVPESSSTGGFFNELTPVKGHSGDWTFRPPQFNFHGWWNITPGRYYVQVQQIDDRAGVGGVFYSPVESITVR